MSNYQGVQFYPRCCRGTIFNSCRSCYCCLVHVDSIHPHDSPWSNIKKSRVPSVFGGRHNWNDATDMPHKLDFWTSLNPWKINNPALEGIARKGPPCLRLLNHLRDKAVGVLFFGISFWRSSFTCHDQKACREQRPKKAKKNLKGYQQVNGPVAVGPANWPSSFFGTLDSKTLPRAVRSQWTPEVFPWGRRHLRSIHLFPLQPPWFKVNRQIFGRKHPHFSNRFDG